MELAIKYKKTMKYHDIILRLLDKLPHKKKTCRWYNVFYTFHKDLFYCNIWEISLFYKSYVSIPKTFFCFFKSPFYIPSVFIYLLISSPLIFKFRFLVSLLRNYISILTSKFLQFYTIIKPKK